MDFKEKKPVSWKIITDTQKLEQVNYLNYLGNIISYDGERDIQRV